MPTYDYLCTSCGQRFDIFQNMSDPPIEKCPSCGGHTKRVITASSGFIIKGNSRPKTACGSDVPCCGRGEPCGKSNGCG